MQSLLNDSRLGRFTVAILAAAMAFVLQLIFVPLAGPPALWLCFTLGVVVGAWYGGLKPGLITTILLASGAIYLTILSVPQDPDRSPEIWATFLFTVLSLAFCVAMQRFRMERFASSRASSLVLETLEAARDIVISVDPELRCVYANARAGQLAKRAPAQLIGRSLRTIFPETPGTSLYRELTRVLLERIPVRFQDHVESTHRWYEFEAAPASLGINLFARDITERKHAEQDCIAQIKAREALYSRLTKVISEAPVGVIIVNASLRVEIANAAACELFGVFMEPGALLVSRQTGTMRVVGGRELDPEYWPLRGTVLTGEPIVNLEVEYFCGDGRRLNLIVNSLALTSANGAPAGALATYSNITAVRELQQSLRATDALR